MSFILPSLVEKTNKCLINVTVMQLHRRPSTQISRKPVVLGYIVAGFGSFWLALLVLWVILGGFGWFRVLVTTDIVFSHFPFTSVYDTVTTDRLSFSNGYANPYVSKRSLIIEMNQCSSLYSIQRSLKLK